MYKLIVARGGPRLHRIDDGACTPLANAPKPLAPPAQGEKPVCGRVLSATTGGISTMDAYGVSPGSFSQLLAGILDTAVIDQTGITGMFDIHLEYAPDESVAPRRTSDPQADVTSTSPAGPSIFTALQQQLGLKLGSTNGPRGFIVIDHVARPSEN